jgi:anthranilate synthase/phosphoribosyltransferase
MILLIDNYDSFTHNLYQYLKEITEEPVKVIRNDLISCEQIAQMGPSAIIISPGPGRPDEAGVSEDVIRQFMGKIPILGVCLGHQAIGDALGGTIVQARRIVHGKAEEIEIDGKGLFRGMASPTRFTRYHSLAIEEASLPVDLEVTARASDGEIMGVRHKHFILEGVQFHPESIASEDGKKLLRNFLNYRRDAFEATAMLAKLIDKQDLSQAEAMSFMEELTDGNLSEVQIAAFLMAFTTKGASAEEIAGCAQVLQNKRVAINGGDKPCLDTCGTGGDGLHTFNISSLAAVIASSVGARTAKHGNRGVSSQTGSADYYQALGVELNLSPLEAETMLQQDNFAFLFAPNYHSAMRFAGPVRRALKVKTIMNLMGPLVNPARAEYQLIGVYKPELCLPMAQAAHLLGAKRVMVVHGHDGMDEISVSHPSKAVIIQSDGYVEELEIRPEDFGIQAHPVGALKGGNAEYNAELTRGILGMGPVPEGLDPVALAAITDAVLVNTAAALYVYGLSPDLASGYQLAKAGLSDGRARAQVETIIARSQELYGRSPKS